MYFPSLPNSKNTGKTISKLFGRLLYYLLVILVFTLLAELSCSQTCTPATNQYTYTNGSVTSCINCPLACATCTGSTKCLTCQPSATIVTTLSYSKCYCPNGKYYDPYLKVCDACNKVILNCKTCSVGLSSSICLTCNDGFYLYTPTSCAACPARCTKCSSPTQCTSCIYGQYTLINGACVCDAKCLTCETTYGVGCIDCDNKNCKNPGVYFEVDKNILLNCPSGCIKCTKAMDCSNCQGGYFLDTATKSCILCSTYHLDPYCNQCEVTQCTACVVGYRLNMATRKCEPDVGTICLSTEILIDTSCLPCSVIYDPKCNTCNSFGCIDCVTGYMIDPNTNTCMKIPICGDGNWIIGFENCDDRNTMSGDGCSATCQVETDYECLVADKLPTGESFCKYTKDFVVILNYVLKEESSNIAYFYFKFQASTFLLWTEAQLQLFLSPIEIYDANTGTGNVISYNSLVISFSIVNGETMFVLTVDYGMQNIENAYIKFAMDPSQTSFTQINTKPPQLAVFHFIDSKTNSVNLYGYPPDIYAMQNTIFTLSGVIGYISFVFLLLGMCCPVGKLIVLEALAVVQLAFFPVLQFEKIPPTFIGLKKLLPSCGINDLNLKSTVEGQFEQMHYRTMGIDNNIFANYNLGFIFFFVTPLLLGIIGLVIVKFILTKLPRYQEEKNSLLSVVEKKRLKDVDLNNHFTDDLRETVFKRMIFEASFFGLMSGGYLAWVSIFYSLKTPDGTSIFGFIFFLVIWILYAVFFHKISTQQLYLPPHYIATFEHHNTFILKGFGQFRDVYQQLSRHKFYYNYAVEKIYLAFVLERIIASLLIVFVSDLFAYVSVIMAVAYLAFMIGIIVFYRRYQNKKIQSERISMFSFLHRNYALRQSINLLTTIAIQMLYFVQEMNMQDTANFVDTVSTNYLTTELIPILILSFLFINLSMNLVVWILELKSTEIVRKTREMKKFFFSQKDLKPYAFLTEQKKRNKNSGTTNKKTKETTKQKIDEEDKAIEDTMRDYAQKTNTLQPKKSPFAGYTESDSKQKTIQIQSLQNDSARKLNNQIPTVTSKNGRPPYMPQDAV